MKQSKLLVQFGQPLKIQETIEIEKEDPGISRSIASTLKEYQKSIDNLLKDRYQNQKDLIHPHLQKPCNIFVMYCKDGIFVRYDEAPDSESKVIVSILNKSLNEIAPLFSDGVIHFPSDFSNYKPELRGPQIEMNKLNDSGTVIQEILAFPYEIWAKTEFPSEYKISPPPSRPVCLVSLTNELTVAMEGDIIPSDISPREVYHEEKFITHSVAKLNVGWLAIEIYPLLPDEYWKPEYAPIWAELDILAIIAQRNITNTSLKQFDGRGEARKKYIQLLKEFEALLTGLEEPVHQFLKAHPELLCPTHDKCWSKMPFGRTVSDFVFREVYNDYQLVEIEAPIRELFRKDGQQNQELTHAINQITDWVQYIQGNKQKVEDELGLKGISTNPRTLVVIGRSQSLTAENRKKIETLQAQQNKLRIMTYDDVLANAKLSLGRLFGGLEIQGQNIEFYFSNK